MKIALFSAIAAVGLGLSVSIAHASPEQAKTTSNTQKVVKLDVYKDPKSGCCQGWIDHVELNNFSAKIHHPEQLSAVKTDFGIGNRYQSCHTGVSENGYVFEGHIPSKYVHQFLENPPADAIGLSVPGMPVGSPGMEYQNKFQPYPVLLLKKDGSVEEYARISTLEEQY